MVKMRQAAKIASSFLCALGAIIFLFCGLSISEPKGMGTSKSVCKESSDVEEYLKILYSGKKDVVVKAGSEKKLDSKNHSQTSLKEYYEQVYGTKIEDGTCWGVATTSLLEYYGAKASARGIYCKTIRQAAKELYWSFDGDLGFTQDEQDNLLNDMFSTYRISKKGNNDYYNIYDTLVEEVKSGRVVIFAIKGHTMVGCGYVPYTITYKEKNIWGQTKTYKKKQNFVIVNDGWSETLERQYAYFPEREIGTGVSTRWDFGITKVRNK